MRGMLGPTPWIRAGLVTAMLLVASAFGVGWTGPAYGAQAGEDIDLRGRVLGPDDKPVPDARIYLWNGPPVPGRRPGTVAGGPRPVAIADQEGDFRFALPLSRLLTDYGAAILVAAGPERGGPRDVGITFAPAWAFDPSRKVQQAMEATGRGAVVPDPRGGVMRLVRDDAPPSGRILDAKHRPVGGARVTARLVMRMRGENLTEILRAVAIEGQNYDQARLRFMDGQALLTDDLAGLLATTTDGDGRFVLRGVGRERLAELQVSGPSIRTTIFHAYTRAGGPVLFRDQQGERRFSGSSADLEVQPSVPLVGTMRDKESGLPLAGVSVGPAADKTMRAMSDERGRFELTGLAAGEPIALIAIPEGIPYLPAARRVTVKLDGAPEQPEFRLSRGLWARGRIADARSGRPVRAFVNYYALRSNSHLEGLEDFHGATFAPYPWVDAFATDEDGRYAIPVLGGPGILAVQAKDSNAYPRAGGAQHIHEGRIDEAKDPIFLVFDAEPAMCHAQSFHGLAKIDVPAGAVSVAQDFKLDAGETLDGSVLDAEGKPVTGSLASGTRTGYEFFLLPTGAATGRFSVRQYFPDRPRRLIFVNEGRKLAGSLVISGRQERPIEVRLEPWGTVVGRVVDERKRPVAGAVITSQRPFSRDDEFPFPAFPKHEYVTGQDGRFRVEGLAPRIHYSIRLARGGDVGSTVAVAPGETKDIGEILDASKPH